MVHFICECATQDVVITLTYNFYDLPRIDQHETIQISFDNAWHTYIITIPEYGQYLNTISLTANSSGILSLGDTSLEYINRMSRELWLKLYKTIIVKNR